MSTTTANHVVTVKTKMLRNALVGLPLTYWFREKWGVAPGSSEAPLTGECTPSQNQKLRHCSEVFVHSIIEAHGNIVI